MRAFHDSRKLAYRSPYGAIALGSSVTLGIDVWDAPGATVTLRTWIDDEGESLYEMTPVAQIPDVEQAARDEQLGVPTYYEVTIQPEHTAVVWYHFIITDANGNSVRYGAMDGRTGGEGQTCDWEPPSYQLTVYQPRETAPAWYEGGVCYQIFPDRFFRGEGVPWRERAEAKFALYGAGPDHYVIEDWNETPVYRTTSEGRIAAWGLYGGTLEGIIQKLDYLQGLGITILYLNPVFEASSSHRYDTGDYTHIDALLGNEDTFRQLCDEAHARGMGVIIDGVFNHTGCDSKYFNRYGNYGDGGAYQDENSEYRDWFLFDENDPSGYKGWWGVDDLPTCNAQNEQWREFVCGEDGVIRRWLRAGADGWRLDVVDEYPDDFVVQMKAAALAEKPDALLLGEVWEDASNKISYGKLRRYFLGEELDCAMNYPFMEAVIGYMRNERSARDLCETIESLRENYPHEAFVRAFNLLGSHDRTRLFTQLGNAPKVDEVPMERRAGFRLDDGQRGLAKGRLWCASLIQMLMPGVPSVYYGDEAGLEGFTDPYNRAPFPWGREDQDCFAIVRNAIGLRKSLPLFTDGDMRCFAPNDDVFGFWRYGDDGTAACVLINASLRDAHDVYVPMQASCVSDLVSGYGVQVVPASEIHQKPARLPEAEAYARVHLNQLSSTILYFHEQERLQLPMEPGLGVLCHITSLPMDGPSFRGEDKRMVDEMWKATAEGEDNEKLARTMAAVEAVLGGAGLSAAEAVAKATSVLDPNARRPRRKRPGTMGEPAREFVDWLAEAGVKYWQVLPVNPTDGFGSPYAGISAFAGNVRLLEGDPISIIRDLAALEYSDAYQEFCDREADWLEPYVSFMAIRQKLGSDMMWQDWPEEYRHYDPELIENDNELRFYAGAWRRSQYAFEREWKGLRAYANERGVQIVGDMPIYVSADSSDVWANPQIFQLGADGKPAVVAGCPPDAFAVDGQIWGNPVYDWDALREAGYDWWLRRLERAFDLYDVVRLDHFIGFSQYYSIPAGEKATKGYYRSGPGVELFQKAREHFGQLPIIAEDLGLITPGVRALGAACGFPGMDIVQFVDGGNPLGGYQPRPEKIAYTGTHDNQTLLGYARSRYQGMDARKVARELIEKVVTCNADVCVLPLQDLLGLGDDARMNVPGVAEGNWSWQADGYDVEQALERTRELVELHASTH